MSYYEKLKAEFDEQAKDLKKSIETLKTQVSKIEKRLADERNNQARLKDNLQKLTDTAGESLTGDVNAYEKYKVAMNKLKVKIETSADMIKSLDTKILPAELNKLNAANRNIGTIVDRLVNAQNKEFKKRCISIFESLVAERDDFFDSARKIYREAGVPCGSPKLRKFGISVKVAGGKHLLVVNETDVGILVKRGRIGRK